MGLCSSAVLLSLLEIQIEGKHGWAENLPTWKIKNRATKFLYSSRPLTGHHLYLQTFILVILHVPYLLSIVQPSLQIELRILAFMVFFWILEDFLWFVINPAFGLNKFKREHIWWHAPNWWWFMPRDYWLFLPIGFAMYYFSM